MTSIEQTTLPGAARVLAERTKSLGKILQILCWLSSKTQRDFCSCSCYTDAIFAFSNALESYADSVEELIHISSSSKAFRRDTLDEKLLNFTWDNEDIMGKVTRSLELDISTSGTHLTVQDLDVSLEVDGMDTLRFTDPGQMLQHKTTLMKSYKKNIRSFREGRMHIADLHQLISRRSLSSRLQSVIRYATAVADIFTAVFKYVDQCHPSQYEWLHDNRRMVRAEQRKALLAEAEARDLDSINPYEVYPREYIYPETWLEGVDLNDRQKIPFKDLVTQWFHPWLADISSPKPDGTSGDVQLMAIFKELELEESISRRDNQRLQDEIRQLKVDHESLLRRTERIINEIMEAQSQQPPGPEISPAQGRAYGNTTITQGATAVVGDIVHNYIFQGSSHRWSYGSEELSIPLAFRQPSRTIASRVELGAQSVSLNHSHGRLHRKGDALQENQVDEPGASVELEIGDSLQNLCSDIKPDDTLAGDESAASQIANRGDESVRSMADEN